jgi:hypothetical protein
MIEGPSTSHNMRELKDMCNTYCSGRENNVVTLDDSKPELMYFTTSYKLEHLRIPMYNYQTVPGANYQEFRNGLKCGLTGNSRENTTSEKKRASAIQVFMAISRLGNTECGRSQSVLKQQYQSCITTIADLEAEVW